MQLFKKYEVKMFKIPQDELQAVLLGQRLLNKFGPQKFPPRRRNKVCQKKKKVGSQLLFSPQRVVN